MWLGKGTGPQSPGGCHPQPPWQEGDTPVFPTQAGEGPATYPAVQEHSTGATGSQTGSGAPGRQAMDSREGIAFKAHKGSDLAPICVFRPTLCLSHFVPHQTSGQKEITFAKLRAKNSSAHPTKPGRAGQRRQHLRSPKRQVLHGAPGDQRPQPLGPG